MIPLALDLQTPKSTIADFILTTMRVLSYLPEIISTRTAYSNYLILSSDIAGTQKFSRPINISLYIFDSQSFADQAEAFIDIMKKIKMKESLCEDELYNIDSVVYTIQQSMGVGMDFLCNPNSSRKHVGNRFEELIRIIMDQVGIRNEKVVLKIPYPSEYGEKQYSCETDLVISPDENISSDTTNISEDEVVISLKTTSKDRMGKIFLDKMLLEKFNNHPVKVVGIFQNDVQRKKEEGVSYTFVSGLFMVYTKFLCKLEGVYFIDPPPITSHTPYSNHISRFSKFISEDVYNILAS